MNCCSITAPIKNFKFIKQYYCASGSTEGRLLLTSLKTTIKMNIYAAEPFSTSNVNGTERKGSPTTSSVSTSPKEDHLQRTANNQRESRVIEMRVSKIFNASPTVKYLVLNTPERPVPFCFKAGQWVDMFIPEVKTVGGFSICSSPIHLSRAGELHLSVKKSDHPPSEWVHEKCKEGSEVSIRIGGDFFLDTNDSESAGKTLLLIAGGVGINPLASIAAQLKDYHENIGIYSRKTLLMFSAKSEAELLFSDLFNANALKDSSFSVQYFVTGKERDFETVLQANDSTIKYGRITKTDVVASLSSYLNLYIGFEDINKNILVYICGPPPMIQHMEAILKSLGINNILYEKWW